MDHAPKNPNTLVRLIHRRNMFLKAFILFDPFLLKPGLTGDRNLSILTNPNQSGLLQNLE